MRSCVPFMANAKVNKMQEYWLALISPLKYARDEYICSPNSFSLAQMPSGLIQKIGLGRMILGRSQEKNKSSTLLKVASVV